MPRRRLDTRRDYRHFPVEYTELLLSFDREGSASIGPMTQRDARASLRDLYRFKMFLTSGVDDDPADEHCRQLLMIASRAVMRLEIAYAPGNPSDKYVVTLSLNPIVAAMKGRKL